MWILISAESMYGHSIVCCFFDDANEFLPQLSVIFSFLSPAFMKVILQYLTIHSDDIKDFFLQISVIYMQHEPADPIN